MGIFEAFVMPGFGGLLGDVYNFIKDYAATAVLIACAVAAFREPWSSRTLRRPGQIRQGPHRRSLFVLG
jgi:hypothetical protein